MPTDRALCTTNYWTALDRSLSIRQTAAQACNVSYLNLMSDDNEPVRTLWPPFIFQELALCEHKTKLVISKRAFRHSAAV